MKSLSKSRSLRKTITRSEELALIGIIALGQQHNLALKDLEEAALAITQEVDGDGALMEPWQGADTGGAFYNMDGRPATAARKVLKYLGITVVSELPRKPKRKK